MVFLEPKCRKHERVAGSAKEVKDIVILGTELETHQKARRGITGVYNTKGSDSRECAMV